MSAQKLYTGRTKYGEPTWLVPITRRTPRDTFVAAVAENCALRSVIRVSAGTYDTRGKARYAAHKCARELLARLARGELAALD